MRSSDRSASASAGEVLPIVLVEKAGEPFARDLDLADRLGFSRDRDIRPLIERHQTALEEFGAISRYRAAKVGKGRPEEGYDLNEAQAFYIASKSDTDNANAVLIMIIRVFVAWRHGHLVPAEGLSASDTGGIVKKVLNKHSREVVMPGVRDIVASENDAVFQALRDFVVDIVRQEAHPLAATHSPLRIILDALRIPTLKRRSLQHSVQHRLHQHLGKLPQKCPLRGVLLYPRIETEAFIRDRCGDLVQAHRDRISPQGLFDLGPAKGKAPRPH